MSYLSFIVYLAAVIALTATMLAISRLLNPKSQKPRTNFLPFESGILPSGSADSRWNVQFYPVAILFVIFDLEAAFLYVWTGVVVDGGWAAFVTISLFILSLLLALVYVWRMGVLEWGKKTTRT